MHGATTQYEALDEHQAFLDEQAAKEHRMLDMINRHILREKINSWYEKGKTNLISNHIIKDVEYLIDNIILNNNIRV